MPAAQVVQKLAPSSLYLPAAHLVVQELWPVYCWNLPAGQFLQLVERVRPTPFDLTPFELYLPAAQSVQELARAPLYVPAAQFVQELARAPLNVPAAQGSHCPSPLSNDVEPGFAGLLYLPAAQSAHELEPELLYSPGSQSVQLLAPL